MGSAVRELEFYAGECYLPLGDQENPKDAAFNLLVVPTDCISPQHSVKGGRFTEIEPASLIVPKACVRPVQEE